MTMAVQLWRYRGLIGNLTQRELKIRHKRTALGWLWSLINPASTLLIYTLVFGTFLKIQPPLAGNGRLQSFALFLFAGLIMWNLFAGVVTGSMGWLLSVGGLLRKIYFPPEASLVAGTLTVLTQTVIESLILVAVMVVLGNSSPTFVLLPFLIFLLVMFSLGLGLIVSMLNVYFRDVSHLVGIGMNLLFYSTPIIYPLSLVPSRAGGIPVRAILKLNPLTQFVSAARDVVYDVRWPSLARLAGLTAVSVAMAVCGWLVFRTRAPDLSEEL